MRQQCGLCLFLRGYDDHYYVVFLKKLTLSAALSLPWRKLKRFEKNTLYQSEHPPATQIHRCAIFSHFLSRHLHILELRKRHWDLFGGSLSRKRTSLCIDAALIPISSSCTCPVSTIWCSTTTTTIITITTTININTAAVTIKVVTKKSLACNAANHCHHC